METRYFTYDGVTIMVKAYDERQKKALSWLENGKSLLYVVKFCKLYDIPCNILIEYVN